jgi:hypothetical protein
MKLIQYYWDTAVILIGHWTIHFGNIQRDSRDYKLTQFLNSTTRKQDAPTELKILFGPDLQVNSTTPFACGSSNPVQVASLCPQHLLVSVAIALPSIETN